MSTINSVDLFCKNCEFRWLEFVEKISLPVNLECQICIAEKRWFNIFIEAHSEEINKIPIIHALQYKYFWLPVRRRGKCCCFCKNKNHYSTCDSCLLAFYAFAGFQKHIICPFCYENSFERKLCEPCLCEISLKNIENNNWV
jgi:hypothetical protein